MINGSRFRAPQDNISTTGFSISVSSTYNDVPAAISTVTLSTFIESVPPASIPVVRPARLTVPEDPPAATQERTPAAVEERTRPSEAGVARGGS